MKDQKGVAHPQNDSNYIGTENQGSELIKGQMDSLGSNCISILDTNKASLSNNHILNDSELIPDYFPIPENLPDFTTELYSEYCENEYRDYCESQSVPHSSVATSRLAELVKLGLKTVTISRDQLILGKYLPEDLIKSAIADSGKKAVVLGAGLGLGKSTVMSSMMQNSETGKGIAVSHRVKLIEQICSTFNAESYQSVKKSDGGTIPNRVGTTIHSLDAICELELMTSAINGEVCAVDEFESVANELNQHKTLRNPHKAIAALKRIASQSKLFIAADAHPSSQSVHLLSVLGFKTSDILFINVERPELEGYKIQIVEQGEDKDITPFTAMVNTAKAKLKAGKKVTIVGLSREKLKQAYEALLPHSLNPIMVTSQTSEKEVSRLNSETYQDFDLVMLSPSMSTGISFDGGDNYNHADDVMVHASNYAGTGGAFDALQALFRDRKPKNITVYYETGEDPLDSADKIAAYSKHRFSTLSEIFTNDQELKGLYSFNRPDDENVNSFLVCNQIKQASDKLDFLGILKTELVNKGAEISSIETGLDMSGEVTPQSMKEIKEALRSDHLEAVVTAIKLSDNEEENENIDDELMRYSLTRKYIESETCIDLDSLSNPDKLALAEKVIPEHGVGVMAQVWNIERAFSDKKKLKTIVNASIGGKSCFDGDKARFLEGNRNTKIYWEYKNKYVELGLKALGIEGDAGSLAPCFDEVVISDDAIKSRNHSAHSLYSSLKQNPVNAIRSGLVGVLTTPEQVKKKPAKFIIDILQNLFDVKARKLRGKDAWCVSPASIETILTIVNLRHDQGVNGVDDYHAKIQDWVDAAPARQKRTIDKSLNTIQTVSNAETSIREIMTHLGRPDLIDDALDWMQPYESRINSGKIKNSGLGVMLLKFIADLPVDNFAKGSEPLKR